MGCVSPTRPALKFERYFLTELHWIFAKPLKASYFGGPAERVYHDENALVSQQAEPRALVEILRRAATEKILRQKRRSNLPDPPDRAAMVLGFLDLYSDERFEV